MQKKIRLVSAQGPTQLLNALAILDYQRDVEGLYKCEDHLVLGGFCANSKKQVDSIMKACTDLASIWDFQSIIYLDFEKSKKQSFLQWTKQVKLVLKLDHVDVCYVCRNWQLFNEVLLESYKESHKICYGDGFGWLDLNDTKWQKSPINPRGYIKIDSAYLFIPIEADQAGKSFSLVDKIVQPPIYYLTNTIHRLASKLNDLKEYCVNLERQSDQGFTIVTCSNYSEAGLIKDEVLDVGSSSRKSWLQWRFKLKLLAERRILTLFSFMRINFIPNNLKRKALLEANMYLDQIKSCCSRDDIILIKPHPRETLNQSQFLYEMLSNNGYHVFRIEDEFSCLPIELFASLLNIRKAICMNSSSSISLPLISNLGPDSIYPCINKDIAEKYINENLMPSDKDIELIMNLISQSFKKVFNPTRKANM